MKYNINLLEKKEQDFLRKILYFLLNYLRYVLVITQLIIIGVFFFRFSVDQSIVDFKDSIRSRQEIIRVTNPIIQEIDKADFQLKEIQKLISSQSLFTQMMEYTFAEFPASIVLSQLVIDSNSMDLTGSAQNARDLQSFYAKLQRDKRYETIELENVKRVEDGYTFTMKLKKFVTS